MGAEAGYGGKLEADAEITTTGCNRDNFAYGYRDNTGTYCYVAPAGYYSIAIGGNAFNGTNFTIQNVPVSAGRITEIVLPAEIKAFASDLSKKTVTVASEAGNMDIQYARDNGDTVTLGMLVHDPLERDVFPENDDFTITENGVKAAVTSIEREPAGANVIMCIDSSGSIKKSLPDIIESACRFVESLPENSTISIIEFKQKLTEYPGNTKEEAVKALRSITAKGDTSLYDAISKALDRLEGMPRAYVIAFTDGVDSREPGDPAPGSAISKEELCKKIEKSSATVLGMGFGSGHDATTLKMISESSEGGQYYFVADVNALDDAFAAVQSKFGNQFRVTYSRPVVAEDVNSEVPVVSIMMDVSGSMNLLPTDSKNDVDIRMERIRSIFHDFVLNLPDNTLCQFAAFTDEEVRTRQIMTQNKASILKGLAKEVAYGGTPIQIALDNAYASLKNVNSSKKVLVFFTDAALKVEDNGSGAAQNAFDETLEKYKEAGIRVLFAGLGGAEYTKGYDEIFKYAADKAGGDYVIANSVDEIEKKLNDLLTKIDKPVGTTKSGVMIYSSLSCKADDGSAVDYSASYFDKDLVLKTKTGDVKTPGLISMRDAGPYITYSGETSALLYGTDTDEETVIDSRIEFTDATASNKFADLTVTEAFVMPKFKGLSNSRVQFLALNVTLTFHKKDMTAKEIGYMIPNVFNHFYVSYNNGKMVPASNATYLAATPFVVPGNVAVQVNELKDEKGNKLEIGDSVSGILIFTVQSGKEWKQLSLHCYDTMYGHIELPLIGALPEGLKDISTLPTTEPAKISDSFDLSLIGCEDTRDIAGAVFDSYNNKEESADYQTVRILEMQFDSKVQALLDINPVDRFYYKVGTNSGDLLTKMSDVVNIIPLGFTGGTKFAPGSSTKVRAAYSLPVDMLDKKGTVWGELATGGFEMKVNSGANWESKSEGLKFEHEYFTLVINRLAYATDREDRAVLDFTVIDKADGEGTGGFDTMFHLYRNPDPASTDASVQSNGAVVIDAVGRKGLGNFGDATKLMEPVGIKMANLSATQELIFGASDAKNMWGAYDGQSRRGVLLFDIPNDNQKDKWRLCSDILPDLSVPISKDYFGKSPLLTKKVGSDIQDDLQSRIDEKAKIVIEEYKATHPQSTAEVSIGLSDDEIVGRHIETPYLTVLGTQAIDSVKTIEDFHKVMQSVMWKPGGESYVYSAAPKTVITQGFGSDVELYHLAESMLNKLGYNNTVGRWFAINDEGRENLARFCGCDKREIKYDAVHAIGYTDENGVARLYVPSFHHYADELTGLGHIILDNHYGIESRNGAIKITAYGYLTGDAGMAAQNLALTQFTNIFGGSEDPNTAIYEGVCLMNEEFDLAEISRNPIDISFISLGKDDDGIHDKITAVADTPVGLLKNGQRWVGTGDYIFDRIEVEVYANAWTKHTYLLDEGDSLLDVFMSIGVNLPMLTDAAVYAYETALKDSIKAFEGNEDTNYGTARWMTHSAIAKMAKSITQYDKEICDILRVESYQYYGDDYTVVCATLKSDGTDAIGSFDLTNVKRTILRTTENYDNGEDWNRLNKAYALGLSSMLSVSEGNVFEGGESYINVWANLPEDAAILNVDCGRDERPKSIELFKSLGAPDYLIERLEKAPDTVAFFIPTAPGKLHGESRWAWIELNTKTMEMISVFDTGERGMASYIIGMTPKSLVEFTAGGLVGIACACFSISAYALEYEDYKQIMKSAKALMDYVKDNMKKFKTGVDEWKSLAKDPKEYFKDKLRKAPDDIVNTIGQFDIVKAYTMYKDGFSLDFGKEPTFFDGFEVVSQYYFDEKYGIHWLD